MTDAARPPVASIVVLAAPASFESVPNARMAGAAGPALAVLFLLGEPGLFADSGSGSLSLRESAAGAASFTCLKRHCEP